MSKFDEGRAQGLFDAIEETKILRDSLAITGQEVTAFDSLLKRLRYLKETIQ